MLVTLTTNGGLSNLVPLLGLVGVVLDRLDDPQLRSSDQRRSGRSRPPQLAKPAPAALRLGGGIELEFADDVVRVIKRPPHQGAPHAEASTIDRIPVKRRL